MAEKGILITDQSGGESVACRDALEQDNEANNRIIQLVDQASRPNGFRMGDSYFDYDPGTGDGDDTVTSGSHFLSTRMDDNAIDVGDATHVAIICRYYSAGASDNIIVTPFYLDPDIADPTTETAVLAIGEPKVFSGLSIYNTAVSAFHDGQSSQKWNYCQPHIVSALGFEKMTLHIISSGVTRGRIFMKPITCNVITTSDVPQPAGMSAAGWLSYDV